MKAKALKTIKAMAQLFAGGCIIYILMATLADTVNNISRALTVEKIGNAFAFFATAELTFGLIFFITRGVRFGR